MEHRMKTDSRKRRAILDYMNNRKMNFTRSTRGLEDTWNIFGLSDTEFQSLKSSISALKEESTVTIPHKSFKEWADEQND